MKTEAVDYQQADLFVRGSATSRQAAEEIRPERRRLRDQVLAFLRGRGQLGATDLEMQELLEMNPSTQRPRRIELLDGGLIEDSGTTRPTPSGRKATVWRAKANG